jgi:hypothetical protein
VTNTLYYGDNLDVLRRHVRGESVDLVYLDPPFSPNANYNILFEEHGEKAAAQVEAFSDTWEWNTDARLAYEEIVSRGETADPMRAFRTMIPGSDMLAYHGRRSRIEASPADALTALERGATSLARASTFWSQEISSASGRSLRAALIARSEAFLKIRCAEGSRSLEYVAASCLYFGCSDSLAMRAAS